MGYTAKKNKNVPDGVIVFVALVVREEVCAYCVEQSFKKNTDDRPGVHPLVDRQREENATPSHSKIYAERECWPFVNGKDLIECAADGYCPQ